MKLTQILLKRKYPRGHLFRGKYRLVKRVEPIHIAAVRNDLRREEDNMLYLRNPYISSQEFEAAFGNERTVRQADINEKYKQLFEKRLQRWQRTVENRKLEGHLMHLRVSESWE